MVDGTRERKKIIFSQKGLTREKRCDIIFKLTERKLKVRGFAGVAEQADARDLKSRDTKVSYRFDPGHRHHPSGRRKHIAE